MRSFYRCTLLRPFDSFLQDTCICRFSRIVGDAPSRARLFNGASMALSALVRNVKRPAGVPPFRAMPRVVLKAKRPRGGTIASASAPSK